ncbi:hypothetical protein MTR67_011699 [Solanum verrucosum]|uniref:Tf2-1-like SH3-like domain-containing protein n=1 Tax=Solanum verrucosum TaxID=315347 RepID=A0AAF0Q7A6_SOLVR|nr:hypothetical protein MTR67_011699 [Solanum verrucosum]
MKGVMRFVKKGKLSTWYIGPGMISKRIDNIAYELDLPPELAVVHPVFHISMLKKCMGDPSLIIPRKILVFRTTYLMRRLPLRFWIVKFTS